MNARTISAAVLHETGSMQSDRHARDFLALAAEIGLKPTATAFPLERANDALRAVKNDAIDGAAVIVMP